MEGTATPFTTPTSPGAFALAQLKQTAQNMSAWLKFLGIVNIVSGAITAISIVGLLIAWLPIWMGVLLFQAGERAANARHSEDFSYLAQMMDKLKTYFVINAVLIIVVLAFVLILVVFAGSFFHEITNRFPDIMQSY